MKARQARGAWDLLVAAGTAIFGFGLPFSPAAVSIGMGLLAIALALRPRLLLDARPWREPVMAIGLVLFAFIALRTLLPNDGDAASWRRLNQYQELLLAPLLLALWPNALHRRILFRAFIVGCLFIALCFWVSLRWHDLAPRLITHRIGTGFALAIAAYLLSVRAPAGARKWPPLAAAAFLAATVMFAIDGRTGQIVLVLLAACAGWSRAPARWRLIAGVAAPALIVAAAALSPAVQGRVAEMRTAFRSNSVTDEANSTEIRVQLIRITAEAVREHWMVGVGFARYAQAHEQAARTLYANEPDRERLMRGFWTRLGNPHDEYALQLVGGGIAAFLLFCAWLIAPLTHARHGPPRIAASLAGIALAFAAGCLFNSMLLDFIEAHLYVGLLAWLVAQERFACPDGEIERIVVVATRQIGDVLLTTPLIRAARERWPQARITVIGFAGTLGMLRGNRDVDEFIETPAQGSGGWSLLQRIWRRWDLALVTDVGDRAHLVAWVAAPCRSGIVPEAGSSNWWKRMLLDHVVVAAGDRGERHVVTEKLDLLMPWKQPAGTPRVTAPDGAPLPQDIASRLQQGFVVVHAPSMWAYKQWPIAHFEQVVRAVVGEGRQVVLTGSASERDRECIAALRAIDGTLDVSGLLDFAQLVTLLRDAALYVGPDTSVSHLAAAMGLPVIAIFGPTNPMRWAPWPAEGSPDLAKRGPVQRTGNVILLQSELHCVPCGRAGCEDHRQSRSDCLVDIGPERVIAEIKRVLS